MTTFLAGRNDVSSFVSNGAAVAALLLSDPKPVVKPHLMPRLVKTRTVKVHSVQSRVDLAFYKGKPQIKTFVIVASTICSQIIEPCSTDLEAPVICYGLLHTDIPFNMG